MDVDGIHIGGHFIAAEFSIEAKLVDEDDFDVFGFRVEFLDGGIEGRLAAREVGPALAVRDGPVIACFHFEDIATSPDGDLGGEEEHNGGFVGPC